MGQNCFQRFFVNSQAQNLILQCKACMQVILCAPRGLAGFFSARSKSISRQKKPKKTLSPPRKNPRPILSTKIQSFGVDSKFQVEENLTMRGQSIKFIIENDDFKQFLIDMAEKSHFG